MELIFMCWKGKAVIAACAASKAAGSPFKYSILIILSVPITNLISLFLPVLLSSFLYPLELSLKEKIETICREMYGADGVEYTEQAEKRLQVDQPYPFIVHFTPFFVISFIHHFLSLIYLLYHVYMFVLGLHCCGIWQIADLHGEDPVLAVQRPHGQGGAQGLHHHHQRFLIIPSSKLLPSTCFFITCKKFDLWSNFMW